jgi:hypothetical protein
MCRMVNRDFLSGQQLAAANLFNLNVGPASRSVILKKQ